MNIKQLASRLLSRTAPNMLRRLSNATFALRYLEEMGFDTSARKNGVFNKSGNPVPWFSIPCNEYLDQCDLSPLHVFEYGSGHSTLYFAGRAANVTSVECDPKFHAAFASKLAGHKNCEYLLAAWDTEFARAIRAFAGRTFEIIINDGGPIRLQNAIESIGFLADGGIVILDNSDWYDVTCRFYQNRGFNRIDFVGPPLNAHYLTTTSLFFRGNYCLRPFGRVAPSTLHVPETECEVFEEPERRRFRNYWWQLVRENGLADG